jgi:hypothetical protein
MKKVLFVLSVSLFIFVSASRATSFDSPNAKANILVDDDRAIYDDSGGR